MVQSGIQLYSFYRPESQVLARNALCQTVLGIAEFLLIVLLRWGASWLFALGEGVLCTVDLQRHPWPLPITFLLLLKQSKMSLDIPNIPWGPPETFLSPWCQGCQNIPEGSLNRKKERVAFQGCSPPHHYPYFLAFTTIFWVSSGNAEVHAHKNQIAHREHINLQFLAEGKGGQMPILKNPIERSLTSNFFELLHLTPHLIFSSQARVHKP